MTPTATALESLAFVILGIEGQVRGIERMVAEDRYCIDVLRCSRLISVSFCSW